MSVYLIGTSTLASLFKLIALLIVFILILVASYYATKWYAKTGMLNNRTQNIHIVESFAMGPGKQICILRLGEKYIAVAVCKDQIVYLTEIPEEQLSLELPKPENGNFKDVFGKMLKQQFQRGTGQENIVEKVDTDESKEE